MAELTIRLPNRSLASRVRLTDPGYSSDSDVGVIDQEASYVNNTIKAIRALQPIKAIRAMTRTDGTLSAAVFSYVQVALSSYSVVAYKAGTHEFDPAGTAVANSVMTAMDTLFDYTAGYSDRRPMQSLVETMLKETFMTGACAGELVLNEFRLPQRLALVPAETITWKTQGDKEKRTYPVQTGGASGEVPLDVPTFWFEALHLQATASSSIFPRSPLEPALNTAFVFLEFIEDMYRVVRRSGHSRLVIRLDAEKMVKTAPPDVQMDPTKLTAHLKAVREDFEKAIAGPNPEDALVMYDFATVDTAGGGGEKSDYVPLLDTLSGLMSTSLKTHPSILGLRLEGSQSLSNTESLVYLKMAKAIQQPVASLLSRMFTLATRLQGLDSYVKFQFAPIDLRPESELEAFKVMKQDRILEALSLGFLSDEEASRCLGFGPRPAGAPPLMGTFFHDRKVDASDVSPNADPQGRALQPDTPNKAGGQSQ